MQPDDNAELRLKVHPWYDGDPPGNWEEQTAVLNAMLQDRRLPALPRPERRAVAPTVPDHSPDKGLAEIAPWIVPGILALREARKTFEAWLQSDGNRRIDVTIDRGETTTTMRVIVTNASNQAFEGVVRAALSGLGPGGARESEDDA